MFKERIREQFRENEPIYTSELLKLFPRFSRAYTFRLLHKYEESRELVKFSNGIYYIPTKTFFGYSTITADMVLERKYICWDNQIYGVYSGLKLLNMFSVSTQVPNVIEIVTNNESTRLREITLDGRTFILRRSRCKIENDNVSAYMVLQLFTDLSSLSELHEDSKQKIIDYMKQKDITSSQLLSLSVYFPAKTIKKLIGSGILNDVAS